MPNALIVDDDRAALEALTILVEKLGFTTSTASTWAGARTELMRPGLDVVILDVMLPGGSGVDLLMEIPQGDRPQVVLVSGDESVGKAFKHMPMQELHFVPKPVDAALLKRTLAAVRRRCRRRTAERGTPAAIGTARLLGDSPEMSRMRELITKVAALDLPVYIEGESGTGKELVARAVHELSSRRGEAFVALNCGALPEALIDSELFGHAKGSFTGANTAREGVFQQAHRGTLFLDEIGELRSDLQVRLLRTLESGFVRPVGTNKEVEVDVRIISATNRRFEQAIKEGRFREDLFYRLCVFPIVTPALRDRPEDIPLLTKHFCAELEGQSGRGKAVAPETIDALRKYSWPGNVRQLRSALQRAFVMADGEVTPECLPAVVTAGGAGSVRGAERGADGDSDEIVRVNVGTSIADAERRLIEATLKHSSGDKRKAAEILGVSLRTLYNRLREYEQPEGAEPSELPESPSRS